MLKLLRGVSILNALALEIPFQCHISEHGRFAVNNTWELFYNTIAIVLKSLREICFNGKRELWPRVFQKPQHYLLCFSLARPAKEELAVFQICVLVYLKKLCLWGSVPIRSPIKSLVCLLLEGQNNRETNVKIKHINQLELWWASSLKYLWGG